MTVCLCAAWGKIESSSRETKRLQTIHQTSRPKFRHHTALWYCPKNMWKGVRDNSDKENQNISSEDIHWYTLNDRGYKQLLSVFQVWVWARSPPSTEWPPALRPQTTRGGSHVAARASSLPPPLPCPDASCPPRQEAPLEVSQNQNQGSFIQQVPTFIVFKNVKVYIASHLFNSRVIVWVKWSFASTTL